MAKILDGKWLSSLIQSDIRANVELLQSKNRRPDLRVTNTRAQSNIRSPGLGVILVGDNPASKTYVANKEKIARECGFETFDAFLSASSSQAELLEVIRGFNEDARVDGILLQLPLPGHLEADAAIEAIMPSKDADGLHPLNQGRLLRGSKNATRPCTPLGVMKLIDLAYSSYTSGQPNIRAGDIPEFDLSGKRAIVLGRSNLVGKPLGLLLLERNATVTMAHSKSSDLPHMCREADIVIAAVGKPLLVKGDWLGKSSVVIDVGINRLSSGQLVGDVDFEDCKQSCYAITPVPKGVGPMTVTMLIQNTLKAYLEARS